MVSDHGHGPRSTQTPKYKARLRLTLFAWTELVFFGDTLVKQVSGKHFCGRANVGSYRQLKTNLRMMRAPIFIFLIV